MKGALKYPGLQNQPNHGERQGWLFQTIRRFLRAQFGQPTGFWGHMAGKIMARTPSDRGRGSSGRLPCSTSTPDDRILEIGFATRHGH